MKARLIFEAFKPCQVQKNLIWSNHKEYESVEEAAEALKYGNFPLEIKLCVTQILGENRYFFVPSNIPYGYYLAYNRDCNSELISITVNIQAII